MSGCESRLQQGVKEGRDVTVLLRAHPVGLEGGIGSCHGTHDVVHIRSCTKIVLVLVGMFYDGG